MKRNCVQTSRFVYVGGVLGMSLLFLAILLLGLGPRAAAQPQSIAVGLVTDEGTLADMSFNWLSYQGLLRAEAELGVTGTVYTSTNPADYAPNLQQCADDGNELCLSVGFATAEAIWNAAQANPGTRFAIVDASWDEEYPANLRGMTFAAEEGAYLAGTLAGLMTDSDVLGVIGGMPIPPVDDFVYGYRNGAQCANLTTTVLISYAWNFGDPGLGAQLAQALMAQGADVIFAPAGGTGTGAVLTATQSGAWGIGVDVDFYRTVFMSGTVEGSEMLLTSALKRLDNAVYSTIVDVISDTFSAGTLRYDLAMEGVGIAPFHEADPSVPQEVRDALAQVEQGILDGSIDVNISCRGGPRYVDGASGLDDGGCMESAVPCGTIGYALSQAEYGDTIRVAQGTYTENLWVDDRITLEGGYEAISWTRDVDQYETIIDASGSGIVPGDWDGARVAKPGVIYDGAGYLMWYDGHNLWDEVQVGLATSNDGISWTKYLDNPVLTNTAGMWDEGGVERAPFVLWEGGVYKMWYEGERDGIRQLGYATSTNGIDWNKYASNPVLEAGPETYDQEAAAHGCVLNEGGTYKLWYHAMGDQGAIIAYATSLDGVDWTKQGPVLQPEGWEEALWGPSVLKLGDIYWMWYGVLGWDGMPAIGVVTSTDGINWSRFMPTPVLTDSAPIGDPHVITSGGTLRMWYSDYEGGAIRYAESDDGIVWVPVPENPVLTSGEPGQWGLPAVRFGPGSEGAVLDGFTVTGGRDVEMGGGVLIGAWEEVGAARYEKPAVRALAASPTMLDGRVAQADPVIVQNCTISGNQARRGGGLAVTGCWYAAVADTAILSNTATDHYGGGVRVEEGAVLSMTDSFVSGNWAPSGGGLAAETGADVTLLRTDVLSNTAGDGGGGIGLWRQSRMVVHDSVIAGNEAGWLGGGIHVSDTDPEIELCLTNCLVTGNRAEGGGVGIDNWGRAILMNVTLADNVCMGQDCVGGLFNQWDSSVATVTNSILWGNDVADFAQVSSTFAIDYSDVGTATAPVSGTGNISADPLFAGAGDYHLQVGSPCIDAGTPEGAPLADLDGNPRDATPDMGAYEVQVAPGFRILLPVVVRDA
ncbi:MAG: BMP family ABC transporter substrate-binding protein [Anaerolineae bacterium]|nr:BMP family ABC transporter substrate-binding protein [Anaerolineae bacterium]